MIGGSRFAAAGAVGRYESRRAKLPWPVIRALDVAPFTLMLAAVLVHLSRRKRDFHWLEVFDRWSESPALAAMVLIGAVSGVVVVLDRVMLAWFWATRGGRGERLRAGS